MLAFNAGERNDHFAKSIAASDKALQLDPLLPEAQIGAADTLFYFEWDSQQCEGRFRQVAEKYPNSAQVQYHCGLCLSALGRYRESLRYLESARRIDPHGYVGNISRLVNRNGRNAKIWAKYVSVSGFWSR
jgi:tetratricopeptide (TPR) repeat protein